MKAPTAPMIASVRMIFPAVFTTVLSLGYAARVPSLRRRLDGSSHPSGDGYAAFRFAQTVLAGIEGVGIACSLSCSAFDTICGTRSVGTPRICLLHLTDRELEFILKRRRAWFHRSGLRLTYECVRLRGFLPVSTCFYLRRVSYAPKSSLRMRSWGKVRMTRVPVPSSLARPTCKPMEAHRLATR